MRPNPVRRVRALTGAFLATVAVYAVFRGIAYLPARKPPVLPGGLDLISDLIPLVVWSALWIIAAAVCVIGLLFGPRVESAWVAIGMTYVWGGAYLLSFLKSTTEHGENSREWLNASTYLGPAVVFTLFVMLVPHALASYRAHGDGDE